MATVVNVSVLVDASVETVWNAWTAPEHIVNWCFASDDWHAPRSTNDLRVGGMQNTRMEAKDGSFGFDMQFIYDEIILHKRIAYHMGDRHVEVLFVVNGESTTVIENFDAENENPVEMQQQGWQMILNNFKKYVESIKD